MKTMEFMRQAEDGTLVTFALYGEGGVRVSWDGKSRDLGQSKSHKDSFSYIMGFSVEDFIGE